MRWERIAVRRALFTAGLLVAASLAGPVGQTAVRAGDPGTDQRPVEPRPTAAQREVARDLMRALAISFESVAAEGGATTSPELAPVHAFITRLPAGARESLVKAARRFTAQGERGLRTFYGPLYAPTPQGRLRNLPALVRSLQSRKALILRPIRPPGLPTSEPARSPASFAGAGDTVPSGPRDSSTASSAPAPNERLAQKFDAPHENHLTLTLQSIRVNSLNDDDTPDDEIYLGVWTLPGPPLLVRVPGSDYWRFTRGQTRTLGVTVKNFGAVTSGHTYSAFIQIFECDDGTWGEIWSAFVEVAEFAFEQWLQAEVGMVAAEIVNYFLNDLWNWIAGWFENTDDFIDSTVLQYGFAQEPRFWAPGPGGSAQIAHDTIAIASGADANYRLTFRWTLRRVPKVR